jgi:hypothetical protein
MRRKMTDNIFERLHSLNPPGPFDARPIVISENPSRDFVFPVSADDVLDRLRELPAEDVAGLTHLWLRRVNTDTFERGLPLAEFVCGSGVRAIVLYPWRSDLRLRLGTKRPSDALLRRYSKWATDIARIDGCWWLQWEPKPLRAFTLDSLLMLEIGHHIDWYRHRWTDANRTETEDRADSYAVRWTSDQTLRFDRSSASAE